MVRFPIGDDTEGLTRRGLLRGAAGLAATGLVGAGLVGAGPAGATATQADRGGTLMVTVPAEPPHLCSAFDSNMGPCLIGSKVLEGLIAFAPDLSPIPVLARSWDISDDGLTYTFALRENVLWHDGHPFTADDVVFSFREAWSVLHPFGRTAYANVVAAEAIGPHQVVFRLSAPAPYLMSYMNVFGAQVLPRHVYEGTDIRRNPANWAPVGTGPFRFVEWRHGSHVRLERNAAYWRAGLPYLDSIVFRFIPDPLARALALRSGQLHMAVSSAIAYPNLRLFDDPDRYTIDGGDGTFLFSQFLLHFNMRQPVLADRRVRLAMQAAIDRDRLLALAFAGHGKAADGPLPSTLAKFHVPATGGGYDPALSERLLDEAGLPRRVDGVRLRVALDFIDTVNIHIPEFLRQQLRQVGIRLDLRVGDLASYLRRIYTDETYDMALNTAHALPDPSLGLQRLYWSKSIVRGVPWSNGARYANPDLDRIMETAARDGDTARRWADIRQWQEIARRDLPILNLIEQQWVTVADNRVLRPSRQADGLFASYADVSLAAQATPA
ncbi:ABC transporter substrate-binding protein [Nitrospirillum iridis]|uniref:Peptide/nickel transport system substrate-binding protein n=1 Tax=Nitrospirillum iridis TaxID=765888 RepID=A0A7X0B403_9PROT|nr:ABC transporter substrate-binding protein [Nitrospirillum iridis]MBB6255318.1 peptide/nickel transport system substrate-binding protein [Nitrospirillum iridis]